MKFWKRLLMVLAILPTASGLHAGWFDSVTSYFGGGKPSAPTIRVLVAHDVAGVDLQVNGIYSLYDPYGNSYLSTRFIGKSRYIQTQSDGLKWGEAFPGLYQLKIKPEESTTTTTVDGKEYIGSMYVYDVGGTISIVNQISVEDYVQAVLAQFKDLNLHPETWAALAIAARTNAYFQAVNPKNTYWAVDAQKVGYTGSGKSLPSSPEIDRAVDVTKYMIMSQTGIYEGIATPFAAQLGPLQTGRSAKEIVVSKISLDEADEMAKHGEHAAQILAKAFPKTTIMLMSYSAPAY